MFRTRAFLAAGLRYLGLVALVAGAGTVVQLVWFRAQAGTRQVVAAQVPPVGSNPRNEEDPAARSVWALATDGWVIRVDGADISIPSFLDQTRARPRANVGVTISPYDRLIISHAKAEGFDWRLIAALIFEESRFEPEAESDKGAYGLMQVRPIAAADVGESEFFSPDDNIRTGVRYLKQLDQNFQDVNPADRLQFILAAYNMGPAHIRDAQQVARRLGYDPARWDSGVALVAPLLELPAIYGELPAGYAQGSSTVAYVQRILDRYETYVREAPVAEELLASASIP